MSQDPDPTIVDLDRYKQAARAARAKAADADKTKVKQAKGPSEPFFGSRPKAPLLLVLLALAYLAYIFGPRLIHGH
jgi:hypothetical protein